MLPTAFYFIPSAMTGFIVSVFPFRNRVSSKEAFEGLELGEGKLSRPVLRGPGGRKAAWLLGSTVPEPDAGHGERQSKRAALMLGTDKSRGYCLEMICADFLAGANLDHGDPQTLLFSMTRFFQFLSAAQRQSFSLRQPEGLMKVPWPQSCTALRLDSTSYEKPRTTPSRGWRCQSRGAMANLKPTTNNFGSRSGMYLKTDLIHTVCPVPCRDAFRGGT